MKEAKVTPMSTESLLNSMTPGSTREVLGVRVYRMDASTPMFRVDDQPVRFMCEMVSVLDDTNSRLALGAKR